jgi:hypothetical protein
MDEPSPFPPPSKPFSKRTSTDLQRDADTILRTLDKIQTAETQTD